MVSNHKNQSIRMLSITKIEKCPCCSSENIVKNGFTRGGNQRVLCYDCLKSRVLHRKFSHDFEAVRRSFLERLSLCGVSRVFLISYYQVYKELNLCFLLLPNFKSQVVENKRLTDTIEFDELCGFCQKKKNKQWLWWDRPCGGSESKYKTNCSLCNRRQKRIDL